MNNPPTEKAMKETKWTKEPWHLAEDGKTILAEDDSLALGGIGMTREQLHETRKRVVKAINLLAGHPDLAQCEIAPRGTIEALRKALDRLTDNDMMPPNQILQEWIAEACRILSQAKGEGK